MSLRTAELKNIERVSSLQDFSEPFPGLYTQSPVSDDVAYFLCSMFHEPCLGDTSLFKSNFEGRAFNILYSLVRPLSTASAANAFDQGDLAGPSRKQDFAGYIMGQYVFCAW